MFRTVRGIPAVLVLLALALGATPLSAQKYGGILMSQQRINPPNLSIHEVSTVATSWPMNSIYSNVVYFDPLKEIDSLDTLIPELAESWSWNPESTRLTLKLHQGVKWHDGKPFTAKDVKFTFDIVRGATKSSMKLNPRKGWYKKVAAITTNGDHELTFELSDPQPSLLLMLASGYSPVYPAHVDAGELRTSAMGTGPFRLIEYKQDQVIQVRKNQDYFIRGRPYLDGIDYVVIRNKGTTIAAMKAGQIQVFQCTETDQKTYENLKGVAGIVFNKVYLATNNVHVIINTKRAPFSDARLRRAVHLAVDRDAHVKAVAPGYLPAAFIMGTPHGVWGLPQHEVQALPGFRDPAAGKEQARRLMRELGYSETRPLKVTVTSRTIANLRDAAIWLLGELRQIHMEPELEVVEDGNWFPRQARRDYTISLSSHGYGVDDPDVPYFEGFSCGSVRNYTDYCDPEAERLFAEQSRTTDRAKRIELVRRIERKLVDDVAKVPLAFRVDYNARWNYVKDYVGHNGCYDWGRMQDVWLDK
ncbi:MAG: ABC transporter substrate-binding protein [Candidatus Lambdaproteobacteria bacterium]|nr:ABC transporter substrate-binding protein [Candidatus Lambdaproteobacteria bacterium]